MDISATSSNEFFEAYIALGDSMSIDFYPYQDACRTGFSGREDVGSASLFFWNEPLLFAEFSGNDLQARFPEIVFSNHAHDGATSDDVLSSTIQTELSAFASKRNLVTLTIGGNDLLSIYTRVKLSDTDELLDAMITVQNKYRQVLRIVKEILPHSTLVLSTIFDPTDGTGIMPGGRFFSERMPIAFLDQFNSFIKNCAPQSGALVADVHQHFLGHGANASSAAEFWYFAPSPIEPSIRGASEIRRIWLDTLVNLNIG